MKIQHSTTNSLLARIFREHEERLANQSFAIVLCGSADTQAQRPDSDIDYVVVTETDTAAALTILAEVRAGLEAALSQPVSNTAVTFTAVADLETTLGTLDGKAAQALLEARVHPERIAAPDTFTIPEVSAAAIRDYSFHNFWTIQALVRKQLARREATAELRPVQNMKLLKLCAIALKMRRQYFDTLPASGELLATTQQLISTIETLKRATPPAGDRVLAVADAVLALRHADFD